MGASRYLLVKLPEPSGYFLKCGLFESLGADGLSRLLGLFVACDLWGSEAKAFGLKEQCEGEYQKSYGGPTSPIQLKYHILRPYLKMMLAIIEA